MLTIVCSFRNLPVMAFLFNNVLLAVGPLTVSASSTAVAVINNSLDNPIGGATDQLVAGPPMPNDPPVDPNLPSNSVGAGFNDNLDSTFDVTEALAWFEEFVDASS